MLIAISVLQHITHMISFKHITTPAANKHTNVCMSDKSLNEYSGTRSELRFGTIRLHIIHILGLFMSIDTCPELEYFPDSWKKESIL